MDLKLKNEVRAFELKQFRNIGYGDNSEENSTLILNYSLNPEYMGDLVILIGPNNSGKSNVLDALSCFANRNISKRDFSDIKINDKNLSLKLFASFKNNKNSEVIYEYELNNENKLQFKENNKIEIEPIFNLKEYIDNFPCVSKILFNDLLAIQIAIKKCELNVYKWRFLPKVKSNYKNDHVNANDVKNYLTKLMKLIDIYKSCLSPEMKKWIYFFQEIDQNCSKYTNEFFNEYLNFNKLTINDRWLSKNHQK